MLIIAVLHALRKSIQNGEKAAKHKLKQPFTQTCLSLCNTKLDVLHHVYTVQAMKAYGNQ